MKKNRSLYKVVLAAVLAFSCNKLIEIPDHPINQISENKVFSDSADIISAIAGVYGNFKANSASGTLGSSMVTTNTGMSSDELLYAYTSSAGFMNNTLTANDGTVSSLWSTGYSNIYQMNSCIIGIGNTTAISDSLKRALVAEMKFTRAFYYFQMVNLWGGVPVVTSTDYNVTGIQPRGTVDEVYGLIKSDLAEARAVLKEKYPSSAGTKMRANLYTAMALSAKVYLYNKQWDSAAIMVNQILNSGLYQLESTPNTVFTTSSQEVIWNLPPYISSTSTDPQVGEAATLLPYNQYSTPSYTINPLLLNAFEEGDLRKASWVKTTVLYGTTYNIPQKYKNRFATGTPQESYVMFRLGDMYLILAEAQAEQGNYADARTNLNKIRTRAGLADYTGADADLLTAIYNERRIEMCYEWGNRWFDLKRTGTIDAVLGAEKSSWTSTAALYPIPLLQITANHFLTQNDGY